MEIGARNHGGLPKRYNFSYRPSRPGHAQECFIVMVKQPPTFDPLVFVPRQGKPQLLFVLLHGESARPEQLFPLADAIKLAFPMAMVVLPYGFHGREDTDGKDGQASVYHWIDPDQLDKRNYQNRVAAAVAPLVHQIQAIQSRFGLTGQQTAIAGFSQGASMALEASHAHHGLAGRVLAFSGLYAASPVSVPPATLLHFFHGASDQQVSVQDVEATLSRLGELQGDATLDVASRIGHELHEALIGQAIVRLQTCVPLRSWEDAMTALEEQARAQQTGEGGTTLH